MPTVTVGIFGEKKKGKIMTDLLLPEFIKKNLSTEFVGREIIYFEETGSTNDEAKSAAARGAADGTLVLTERQSGGKGRLDRKFFCPKGGLWFSIILRPPFLPTDAPKCTLLAAVAVNEALQKFGFAPRIKWPNDIYLSGKKLAGILTEMNAVTGKINFVVVGIGLNANIDAEDFSPELLSLATSLSIEKGSSVDRAKILVEILTSLEKLYKTAIRDGFDGIFERWRKYSLTLGQNVQVIGIGERENFFGKAIDIDFDGALLIETDDGERRRVLAGDVSLRPRTDF